MPITAPPERRYLIPFRSQLLPHLFTDVLVIGAGVAGMRAAIEAAAAGADVIVLAKSALDQSNTAWAQGGVAVAIDEDDSPDLHFGDTLAAGADLCDEPAVRVLVDEAPDAIRALLAEGMRVDREPGGRVHLGREGGHHRARIVHTDGASTGRELVRCLSAWLDRMPSVRLFDACFALDLLSLPGNGTTPGRVVGAITHHPRYGLQVIWARTTILATGGLGQLYRETTNPRVATGDGVAMAWRAGALVGDLEFVQFHPTTLYVAGATRMLISEAVRGAGAVLVNEEGERFMARCHEMADLAPRDVVSRAILQERRRTQGGSVYLDVRHLGDAFARQFPDLDAGLRSFGLESRRDLIPVHPSAHYALGGVWTDLSGQTSVPGLMACGEASCMGLHGANRLASNSLLEGLVFGRRTGAAAALAAHGNGPVAPARINSEVAETDRADLDIVDVRSSLRSAMWRHVGIERSGPRLADILDMIAFWSRYTLGVVFDDPDGWETQNMLEVGAVMVRAGLWRCESRGAHRRLDHPEAAPAFRVHARWCRGRPDPDIVPVRSDSTGG
ncbi:MAG: L-aspartate oxidase [Phycisphaeraceae bacterium]|nr:L-aspartate oxidase [Phycisphaeraceae bacterium]